VEERLLPWPLVNAMNATAQPRTSATLALRILPYVVIAALVGVVIARRPTSSPEVPPASTAPPSEHAVALPHATAQSNSARSSPIPPILAQTDLDPRKIELGRRLFN